MKIEANTLYLAEPLEAMKHLAPSSIDLVVADPTLYTPPAVKQAPTPVRPGRSAPPARAARFDPLPLLVEAKRVLKLFSGFFFCSKNQLPAYIAFAQQNGYAWDLLVWEHGYMPHEFSSNCDFIVTIWERDAYFNPEFRQSFFHKVKHHSVGKNRAPVEFPAEKPRKLILEFILQRTKPGDLVLDPNCGAGSVPAVCVETGRNFIAFENNPRWYAEAKRNIEKAALEASGSETKEQLLFHYGR